MGEEVINFDGGTGLIRGLIIRMDPGYPAVSGRSMLQDVID
jgi:hypothetical protein